MSFSAMRKAAASATEVSEQTEDGPPLDVAPKLLVVADAADAATPTKDSTSPAADAAPEAPATPDASTSLDDELGAVAVARDIQAEPVEPPTRTEAETEKLAADQGEIGGDPATPATPVSDTARSATSEVAPASAAASTEAPEATSSAQNGADKTAAGAEKSDGTAKPFRVDEEELRGYGLDKLTMDSISGLNAEQAYDVVAEIRAKNSFVNDLQKKKSELENAIQSRRLSAPSGGGLFSAVAKMFQGRSSEERALARTDGELGSVQDYLSNQNIRDRVHRLRRQEIVDAANALSVDNRRLSAASQAFNATVLSTPAGQAIEAEIAAITERHPDLSRNDIITAAKAGTLNARIGENTISSHVRTAFEDERVKRAWDKVAAASDVIETHSESLLSRMQAYEDHFPGSTDTEKLSEAVNDAMSGLEKTLREPMVEDPEATRSLQERLAKLAKMVAEFFEKLLSKFGLKR